MGSCHFFGSGNQTVNNQIYHHSSAYDDSTLNSVNLPVLMPYNRIIAPAGAVVAWGNLNLENHSLDVKSIPGTDMLAVEDRHGIAIIDSKNKTVAARWSYAGSESKFQKLVSTYSGIQVVKVGEEIRILWSAAKGKESYVMQALWDGKKIRIKNTFTFKPEGKSPLALPNEIAVNNENGINYLYVVLNGNNTLVKLDLEKQLTIWSKPTGAAPYGITILNDKAYVTNWAGPQPANNDDAETSGIPYGEAYTDPKTGSLSRGSVSVLDITSGALIKEIEVGLHPNDIIHSSDNRFIFVSNGNSDNISVIDSKTNSVTEEIPVMLHPGSKGFIGDSPNALVLANDDRTLYVANGMDNAVAVVKLGSKAASDGSGKSVLQGFIPTEAYPCGIELKDNTLFVTNLEGEGPRVNSLKIKEEDAKANVPDTKGGAYNSHKQIATLSIIPVPDNTALSDYTKKVRNLNLAFRAELARTLPRKNIAPKPVPERIGEPSVFKHVIYIIKENRTYDQILGDMKEGDGREDLCLFGNKITPNHHQLAKDFLLLDNYYASGKSSAEGHQWTDAAMVTDYVEKNVSAWLRSYPHVQTDALVYNKKGFLWNNATEHGKSVRIYGEANTPHIPGGLTWTEIYQNYLAGKPLVFTNTSTISSVRPLMCPDYPGFNSFEVSDQQRASVFLKELKEYEDKPGDQLPQLMILALPADHTAGTRPGIPTPRAMVADNDLALGRIIETLTKSRFWKETVVFVTEDDSQAGWDHVSAYRTMGFVISPYSRLQSTVHTNYNQTCVVRTIEQILGIPPMNAIDATALPMFQCFTDRPSDFVYHAIPNKIPLNELNPKLSALKGKDLYYAKLSLRPEFNNIDGGNDDMMNRIIWYYAKGKEPYPKHFAGKPGDDDDDD